MYIQNTYLQPNEIIKKGLQGKLDRLNFFVYLYTISVVIVTFSYINNHLLDGLFLCSIY